MTLLRSKFLTNKIHSGVILKRKNVLCDISRKKRLRLKNNAVLLWLHPTVLFTHLPLGFQAQTCNFPGLNLNSRCLSPLLRGPGCLHRGAPGYRGAPCHSRVWRREGCFLFGSLLEPCVLPALTSCCQKIWYLLWERVQQEGEDPVLLDVKFYCVLQVIHYVASSLRTALLYYNDANATQKRLKMLDHFSWFAFPHCRTKENTIYSPCFMIEEDFFCNPQLLCEKTLLMNVSWVLLLYIISPLKPSVHDHNTAYFFRIGPTL